MSLPGNREAEIQADIIAQLEKELEHKASQLLGDKKPRKKREMTPEMLENLAKARAKAMEIRKELKQNNEKKVAHYTEKIQNKPKPRKVLYQEAIEEVKLIKEKEKTEKREKAKQLIVYQDASDEEDQLVYIKKSKAKARETADASLPHSNLGQEQKTNPVQQPQPSGQFFQTRLPPSILRQRKFGF